MRCCSPDVPACSFHQVIVDVLIGTVPRQDWKQKPADRLDLCQVTADCQLSVSDLGVVSGQSVRKEKCFQLPLELFTDVSDGRCFDTELQPGCESSWSSRGLGFSQDPHAARSVTATTLCFTVSNVFCSFVTYLL